MCCEELVDSKRKKMFLKLSAIVIMQSTNVEPPSKTKRLVLKVWNLHHNSSVQIAHFHNKLCTPKRLVLLGGSTNYNYCENMMSVFYAMQYWWDGYGFEICSIFLLNKLYFLLTVWYIIGIMQYNFIIFSRLNVLISKKNWDSQHVTPTCALALKQYKNTLSACYVSDACACCLKKPSQTPTKACTIKINIITNCSLYNQDAVKYRESNCCKTKDR